ncbi:MAG: hypothetical protein N4A35_09340 [Flavobacteriales bacterium]|jgi:hypothetical protein|nr:hypothetical protein [Flavobacteriales bacterium]
MNFKFVLFFSLFFIGIVGFSQDRLEGLVDTTTQKYAKNAYYLELAGKGFYYSVNYERSLFSLSEKTSIKASVGFSAFPGLTHVRKSYDFSMPIAIVLQQHLKNNHHLSLSTGSTYFNYLINDIEITNDNLNIQPVGVRLKPINEWFGHISLDYRYNNPSSGLLLKGGITPLFFDKMQNFQGMKTAQLSANIAVGYTF